MEVQLVVMEEQEEKSIEVGPSIFFSSMDDGGL